MNTPEAWLKKATDAVPLFHGHMPHENIARAVITAVEADIRLTVAEDIAAAIRAASWDAPPSTRHGLEIAARIARDTGATP